jgi:hypothetical protein
MDTQAENRASVLLAWRLGNQLANFVTSTCPGGVDRVGSTRRHGRALVMTARTSSINDLVRLAHRTGQHIDTFAVGNTVLAHAELVSRPTHRLIAYARVEG